ncbi:unnamed protein product [Parnassius apollo]|uniref:(apollo) hypothetical protein n=1 Tax=Parnassius apollo TaxID=110799 RepID=A0A8S3WFV6_PARAO|nr:unnamed protein product [Parnassius apollo]
MPRVLSESAGASTAGGVRRMRWTKNMNANALRAYYRVKGKEIPGIAFRARMHCSFAELEPSIPVTEQNLADQARYIMRSKIFYGAELERLRREATPTSNELALAGDAAPQAINQHPDVEVTMDLPVVVDSHDDEIVSQELEQMRSILEDAISKTRSKPLKNRPSCLATTTDENFGKTENAPEECFGEVNQIKKSLPLCSESISSIREVEGDSMDLEVNAQDELSTQKLRSPPIDMLTHKHVVRSVEELEDYSAPCEVDTAESSEKTYRLEGRRILNLKTFYLKLQEVSSHRPFNCGLGSAEIVSEKQTGYQLLRFNANYAT